MVAKSCIPCRTRIAARRDEEVQRVLVTNKPVPLFNPTRLNPTRHDDLFPKNPPSMDPRCAVVANPVRGLPDGSRSRLRLKGLPWTRRNVVPAAAQEVEFARCTQSC